MKLTVATRPGAGDPPQLDYCWDADTGILGARLSRKAPADGQRAVLESNGIVQIVAPDGAWMHFEITDGSVAAIEIAIWPELAPSRAIRLPETEDGYSEMSFIASDKPLQAGAVVGVTLPVQALPDFPSRTVQLRFGTARAQRTVRVADALLVGTDRSGQLASLWLLQVPGFVQQPSECRALNAEY